jgi:hypothetical protein
MTLIARFNVEPDKDKLCALAPLMHLTGKTISGKGARRGQVFATPHN